MREQTVTDITEEFNTSNERDHQVDTRFALHREVDASITEDQSLELGYTAPKAVTPQVHVMGKVGLSRTLAFKLARDQSKQVIDKSVSKLVRNFKHQVTTTLLNETEETNTHSFGPANKDISRQYTYVDQTRKAQVFSYGTRMMLDFVLPEPSELLKRLMEKEFDMVPPEKCCFSLDDISPDRYDEYVSCCGLTDLEAPPQTPPVLYRNVTVNRDNTTPQIDIPPRYRATSMAITYSRIRRNWGLSKAKLTFHFGGGTVSHLSAANGDTTHDSPATISETQTSSGSISKSNVSNGRNGYSMSIRITLTPDPVDLGPWKRKVHKLLMEKCEKEQAEYEAARAEFEAQKKDQFNQNPRILDAMMRDQLKQAAISYITCQFFDGNDAMKHNVQPCGFPQMDLQEAEKEGIFIRFFEQAFEWNFMNYVLYPYFWGRKCSWADKIQQDSGNYSFEKFLQAGAARVSLTVRPEFEIFVAYYLATGQIWGSTGIPPIVGPGYVPIIQEIKEQRDNFNADRDGHVICDTGLVPALAPNQIVLRDNLDYFNSTPTYVQALADIDLNREIFINCNPYRIMDIAYVGGEVVITLDRPFAEAKDF
ncbi:MAG: hypothetical protein AAF570_15960, partial [Bacteroidota bacterium]